MCRKVARGSGKGGDEAGEALLEGGKRCVCVCVCVRVRVFCFPDGQPKPPDLPWPGKIAALKYTNEQPVARFRLSRPCNLHVFRCL